MASSGKKGKKTKWRPADVTALIPESQPGVTKSNLWSDEVELDERESLAAAKNPILPTAPRSVRGNDDERVPMEGPFVAYLTNVPFEAVEEDIAEFFQDLVITNIRLPKADNSTRLKGYGYVEFAERVGLCEALRRGNTDLKGRKVRVDVSDNTTDRRFGGGSMWDRMGMNRDRDRDDDPDRTSGDWRSGPRAEPADDRDRFMSRSSGRRDFGGFREDRETPDSKEGGWRESMGSTTDRDRDRNRDRDYFRGREGFGDRDRDRGFGERRGFGDRDSYDRDRGGRFSERDGFGRSSDRDREGYSRGSDRDRDGPPRRYDERDENREKPQSSEDGPPPEPSEPRTRPKLNLIPRTKPLDNPPPPKPEEPAKAEPAPAPAPAPAPPVPRASIFGAAKPVDTAAREREIEERLAKQKEKPRSTEAKHESKDKDSVEQQSADSAPVKKMEPAPPPKANAWARRLRMDSDAENGESPRQANGAEPRVTSPSRQDDDHRNRKTYNRDSKDHDREDSERERNNREGRGGPKDKDSHQAGDHPSRDVRSSASDRYDRQEVRGRARNAGHQRVEKVGGTKAKPAERERHNRRDDNEVRMPKLEEKKAPSFAGSNTFSCLDDQGEEQDLSD